VNSGSEIMVSDDSMQDGSENDREKYLPAKSYTVHDGLTHPLPSKIGEI
jgi:hypothetical protein